MKNQKKYPNNQPYQDDLIEDYHSYDYSQVEDIAGVNYKKAMIITGIYIFLHLFAKDYFPYFSTIWILVTTILSISIWIYFKRYFDAMNDRATGKWLFIVIGALGLYGLINVAASFIFSVENLQDFHDITKESFEKIFRVTFYLSCIPILAIFIAGIRILNVNHLHPFPLKRIAISSMLLIPIYMLVSLVENMPLTNQIIEAVTILFNLLVKTMNYLFGLSGNEAPLEYFRVGFWGNLFLMIPYYFLLHHFYRAEVDDATP